MKMILRKIVAATLLALAATSAFATAYTLPASTNDVVGQLQTSTTQPNDNVITVAQRYDLGHNAVADANPQLNMTQTFLSGQFIQVPTEHLLPDEPRRGIVVNLPEMRLYYYPAGTDEVLTYPVGIGKINQTIPIQMAVVTYKKENPTWTPPPDIRVFDLQHLNVVLPKVMPAGPDNPLGPYAIYMTIPTYLIHSTIFPESVGTRASFGCIRMYRTDISQFFPLIRRGVPIAIIDEPIKAGWEGSGLYLEAYQPLSEHSSDSDNTLPGVVHMLTTEEKGQTVLVDWQEVAYITHERDGIPHDIGIKIPQV